MSVIEFVYSDKAFVKNPSVEISLADDGSITLAIPTEGLAIKGSKALAHVIARHESALTISESQRLGTGLGTIRRLIHCRALVPEEIAQLMARGTTSHAREFLDTPKTDLHDLSTAFALIGSAVDFAQVGLSSTYRGPDAIRENLPDISAVSDLGNVTWLPSEGLLDYGKRLAYLFALAMDKGAIPLVLGGDHSLTYFTVATLCATRKRIGLIQFDAHNDLGKLSSTRELEELTHANVAGYLRQLPLVFILQAGLRPSQISVGTPDGGCAFYQVADDQIDDFGCVLSKALTDNPVDGLYISVDLDCVNPDEAPQVATPLPGKMSSRDVTRCLKEALKTLPLLGADFVEVVACHGENQAAAIAASLIMEITKEA